MSSGRRTHEDDPVEAAEQFREIVLALGSLDPIRRVVLIDRAGRVIARHGIEERAQLTKLATLAAALHAASARIAELADDPGRAVLRMETSTGVVVLIPLARPSTHLVLLVLDGPDSHLPGEAEPLLREIAWVDSAGWSVTDPLEFEASLTRPLDTGSGEEAGGSGDVQGRPEAGAPGGDTS